MFEPSALVREARGRAGLTQAELARRLGAKQPVIARLEKRGANPRLQTLQKVIAATGYSLELAVTSGAGIDESMIAADIKLTPDERLSRFEQLYTFAKDFGGIALKADGS